MEKKILFKSWDLLSQKEQDDFISSVREDSEEELWSDEDSFIDHCIEIWNDYFYDDFGLNCSNLTCSKIADYPAIITGTLGLWDGKKEIVPVTCDSVARAIYRCINNDYQVIYEDENGDLFVEDYHHDGVNVFKISLLIDGEQVPVRYLENVFGEKGVE